MIAVTMPLAGRVYPGNILKSLIKNFPGEAGADHDRPHQPMGVRVSIRGIPTRAGTERPVWQECSGQ